MRDHVKILGILNMVLGGLGLVVALGVFALFGGIAGAAGMANSGNDGLAGAGIVAVIGLFLAGLITVISLPQLIGGWGLINYKPWARVLMIVVSVVSLLHVPLGTALGVYGLWVLFNDETKYLFASGGRPPIPYSPAYPAATGGYGPGPAASYPAPIRPEAPAPTPGYPSQPPQ
jgi:hypothetical protein